MNPIEADPAKPTLSSSTKLLGGAVALAAGFLISLALQYLAREPLSTLHSGDTARTATADARATSADSPTVVGSQAARSVVSPRQDVLQIDVQTEPATARLWLDGKAVGVGRFTGTTAADGTQHELRVEADGYTTHVLAFRERPPHGRVALMPDEPVAASPPTPLSKPSAARVSSPARRGALVAPTPVAAGLAAGAGAPSSTALVAGPELAPAPLPEVTSESQTGAQPGEPSLPSAPNVRLIDDETPQIRVIE